MLFEGLATIVDPVDFVFEKLYAPFIMCTKFILFTYTVNQVCKLVQYVKKYENTNLVGYGKG